MTKIYVNGHGWVMGGNKEKGLKFTSHETGAKPFDLFSKELFEVRFYIERSMKCNYDLVEAR